MSSILKAKQRFLMKNHGIKETEQEHLQVNQVGFGASREKINLYASQTLPGKGLKYANLKVGELFDQKSQGYSQDCLQGQSQSIPPGTEYRQRNLLTSGMKKKFNIQNFQKVTDKKNYNNQIYQDSDKNRANSSQKKNMNASRSVVSKSPQPAKKIKAYSPSPQFAKTQRNDSKPHLKVKDNQSDKNSDFSAFSGKIQDKKQRRKTILGPGSYDFENGPQRQNPFQRQIIGVQPNGTNNINMIRMKTTDLNFQNHQVSFTERQPSVMHQSPSRSKLNFGRKTVHQFDKLTLLVSLPPSRRCNSPVRPKDCENQYIQNQIAEQKSKTHAFYDDIFPPRQSIIFTRRIFYQQEGLSFERLTKIYENKNIGILQFSQPSFLEQGKFTSPAVFSAMTILCEDPMRVANIFGNQHFNSHGIYYLNLCKEGVWRNILIDDFMPVKNTQYGQKTLLFINSVQNNNTNQIWPCLLQKGLAKIYGSYQDLRKSTNFDGVKGLIKMLTGFPCAQYELNKDFRSYLIIIDAALKRKHIVILQKVRSDLHETARIQNIAPLYSFQIIQLKKNYLTIRNFAQEGLTTNLNFEEVLIFSQLLIFRNQNPMYSVPRMQRQRQLNAISKSPSKSSVQIGNYSVAKNAANNQKSYNYWSYTLRHKRKYFSILKICLLEDSRCYLDVWQSNPANFKKLLQNKQPEKYSASPYQIKVIAFGESDDLKFQSNKSSADSYLISQKDSGKQIQLKKGYYLLQIHLCQKYQRDFTLSYYGKSEIDDKRSEKIKNYGQLWEGVTDQGQSGQLYCTCKFNESKLP